MALFKKKRTLDEILEDVKNLSPKEAKELHEKMSDLYKAEDEREIDKIEEEKADTDEVKDEKADEVNEESEEIGKDVDEVKDEVATDEAAEEPVTEEETEVSDTHEIPDNDPEIPSTDDNTAELIKTLTDRVNGLVQLVGELHVLKEKMDEYVYKQKEAFGYKSEGGGARKNYEDMSASELKNHILNN